MSDTSWGTAMVRLRAVQESFVNGDAAGIKELYSHRDDVTVFGGFGGYERGWAEVGPRLEWAASQFAGGTYNQETSARPSAAMLLAWRASNAGSMPMPATGPRPSSSCE